MNHSSKRAHLTKLERRRAKWGYIFMLPWIAFFLVFYLYPLIYGIGVSFTDMRLAGSNFIGLRNYGDIFRDYAFWRSLLGTFCYAIIVIPLQVFIPLLVANYLRRRTAKVNSIVKLLIYMPSITCAVAMVLVWNFMIWPNSGILSQILAHFGVTGFSVFDHAKYSIPVISLLIAFTNMGSQTVIYSAAINGIPETYYEAATLDGATNSDMFRKITIPMLHPTLVYVFITSTISALQIFVVPQLMTGGGPNYTSSTLLMMVYQSAFTNNRYGYASALGVVLFLLTAIMAVIQFRVTKRDQIEY